MDGHLARRTANALSRPRPVAIRREPYFDDEGHFIHPCRECGRNAYAGVGENLRAGELGVWLCSACKSQTQTE
jgi:hypothetical protein